MDLPDEQWRILSGLSSVLDDVQQGGLGAGAQRPIGGNTDASPLSRPASSHPAGIAQAVDAGASTLPWVGSSLVGSCKSRIAITACQAKAAMRNRR